MVALRSHARACGAAQRPIAVTPRSSQDLSAGFNAGMFIFQPSRDMYMQIMEKFLSMKEEDMFATTEQDFLNQHFKARYNLIPIDYLMKVPGLPPAAPTPSVIF
jgi:lipopolysaccharide biosynthesis glycosyltransferase